MRASRPFLSVLCALICEMIVFGSSNISRTKNVQSLFCFCSLTVAMKLNLVVWCLIFGIDFVRAGVSFQFHQIYIHEVIMANFTQEHETYVTDFKLSFNREWFNVTSIYHLDQRQRNLQDLYVETLKAIPNNFIVSLMD
jgi:hypothetical protein